MPFWQSATLELGPYDLCMVYIYLGLVIFFCEMVSRYAFPMGLQWDLKRILPAMGGKKPPQMFAKHDAVQHHAIDERNPKQPPGGWC